jgi:hypothetical protein
MSVTQSDLRRLRTIQRRRRIQMGSDAGSETELLYLFVRIDGAKPPIAPDVQWAADPTELPQCGIGWAQVIGKSVEVFKGTWEIVGSDGAGGFEL